MQEDRLDSSVRRSKEAYVRIKTSCISKPTGSPKIEAEHKSAVTRISQVVAVLESIEKAKGIFAKHSSTLEENVQERADLKEILKVLSGLEASEVVKEHVKRAEKRIKKIEAHLDKRSKAMLEEALETGKPGWCAYLVRKKKKAVIFVEVVQEHIEKTLIPKAFAEEIRAPEVFIDRVERLAYEAFDVKETKAVMDVLKEILKKEIRKKVANECYTSLKSLESANTRIRNVSKIGECFQKNYAALTGESTPESTALDILKNTCKNLFMEAESAYSRSKIDEKSLLDRSLIEIIKIVREVDRSPKIFEKWSHKRQPILRTIMLVSEEKSRTVQNKLKSLIFLNNSMHLLKEAGADGAADSKETTGKIVEELRAMAVRAVEMDAKSSEEERASDRIRKETRRAANLLKFVESLAASCEPVYLPTKHRKIVLSGVHRIVEEMSEKVGGMDEVSAKHLLALIDTFFNGSGA